MAETVKKWVITSFPRSRLALHRSTLPGLAVCQVGVGIAGLVAKNGNAGAAYNACLLLSGDFWLCVIICSTNS
jgi:hypothetical protein